MVSLAERRLVVRSLWRQGQRKVSEIQKITRYPKRTLHRWATQLAQTGDLKQKKRPGRPRRLNAAQRKHLGQIATKKNQATSLEITETLKKTYPDLIISPRTVRENLRELGFKVCVPRTIPFLTEKAKLRRLEWARSHLRRRWNKTVFSDEATFQMFRNTMQVRYKSGRPRPSRGVVKHPFKVHVWAAFCVSGTVGFHIFTGKMNGERYRNILLEHLFEQAYDKLGNVWTFQQDNDPKHTAKLTIALLHDRCPRLLEWPSSSPDLNPIENLWAIMKKKVEREVSELIREKKKITQQIFTSIITEEWQKIDADTCQSLVRSMKRRLELVIESKGDTTKY
jgi:transposase